MRITVADIRAHEPCYDPTKYVAEDWSGTLLDVLNLEAVPPEDRLWVVAKFLDDKTNRIFAVWCAREALKLTDNPDPRSIAACDVAERFMNGKATDEEFRAARAAWAAASTGRAAARAAWAAATDIKTAASDSAWAAASDSAWAAAWIADGDASRSARDAQIEKLKEMLREGA